VKVEDYILIVLKKLNEYMNSCSQHISHNVKINKFEE